VPGFLKLFCPPHDTEKVDYPYLWPLKSSHIPEKAFKEI
jgi:hypothetical protein